MPRPGPWKVKFQASCLTCRVRFTGSDQVSPSSVERTITSWGVVAGSKPLPAVHQAAFPASPPWVQAAKTSRSPVTSSTRMQGSPTPLTFCGSPPHSPMSMATIIGPQVRPPSVERLTPTSTCPCRGPQVRPPSVERLTPTSTCPCRSREFSYRMSYTPTSVPFFVVTKPGMR